MSAVSSRPRIRAVASRAVETGALGGVAVGAVVTRALGPELQGVFADRRSLEPARVDRLAAGPEVAAHLARLRQQAHRRPARPGVDPVVEAKAAAVYALSRAPLVVQPAAVTDQMQRLLAAPSVAAVRQAEADLLAAAQAEHGRLLGEALVRACRQASIASGFHQVETTAGIGGVLRLVATDDAGRALVTEIHRGDDTRFPSIATEVVGVTDRRCQAILDRFDAALAAQGVQTDGRPDRKWTGGVGELALAREFIRTKVTPTKAAIGPARRATPGRRRSAAAKLLRHG